MNPKLKSFMIETFGLAADATDEVIKAAISENLKSGELSLEKYDELQKSVEEKSSQDKFADMLAENAKSTTEATAKAVADAVALALKATPTPEPTPEPEVEKTPDFAAMLKEMEEKLTKKINSGDHVPAGNDGAALMKMAIEDNDEPRNVRVKQAVESYSDSKTALTYKSKRAGLLNLKGQPMQYNGKEVNKSTDRTKFMSAVWAKFQTLPEHMTEKETEVVRYILHREKFHMPNSQNRTDARHLTDVEIAEVYDKHKNFYVYKTLIDDSTSGGENAVPEFFDMDMIISPTLASENLVAFCNVVPVARGSAAQNFVLGRPTVAAEVEGSAATPFSTTGFITNHDTSFFRAMGAIEIGKNFLEDAHPRLVTEILNQYSESAALWFNEQIMTGDGTTEPQGITVASGTTDVTPANPTTGAILLTDAFDLLFGVSKAYRNRGGSSNAIYVMTDTAYKSFRAIATGVTGDTRLIFGDDIESYEMFGHPVLIEEGGMTNADVVFAQMKGYRLYVRQGLRFFREDAGRTLALTNTTLMGVDFRAGGQLDEGGYAAVIDALSAA